MPPTLVHLQVVKGWGAQPLSICKFASREGLGCPAAPSREGLGAPNPCPFVHGWGAQPCPFASREGLGGPAGPSREGLGGPPAFVYLQVVKGWGGPTLVHLQVVVMGWGPPTPFASREGLGGAPTLVHLETALSTWRVGGREPRESNFVGFRVINIY